VRLDVLRERLVARVGGLEPGDRTAQDLSEGVDGSLVVTGRCALVHLSMIARTPYLPREETGGLATTSATIARGQAESS